MCSPGGNKGRWGGRRKAAWTSKQPRQKQGREEQPGLGLPVLLCLALAGHHAQGPCSGGGAALLESSTAQRLCHLGFQDGEKSCGDVFTWGQTVLSPRAVGPLGPLCFPYASMKRQNSSHRGTMCSLCLLDLWALPWTEQILCNSVFSLMCLF